MSIRIPRELKERADKLGINISEVMRKALEEEVKRREIELMNKALEKVRDMAKKINIDELVRLIRENRENR